MSVTFSTGFHIIKPGLRISGDEISVVFVDTYDSGLYAGKKYIHIDLTNETDLTFVEAGVNGPLETVADVDALYNQLKAAGMTEAFEGFLVDPSDLSSIQVGAEQISFDFAGHQPYVFSRNPDPTVTERTKVAHQTWSLPQADFSLSGDLFGALESPEEVEFVSIENRLALLEATNGLIKEDYNFITLVGTATPDPGQVGINAYAPSAVEMLVLPNVDVDGKALNYSDFKAGDRMGLKQPNGSAAIYELEPVAALGDHFRFNVELLTLGYYGDQDFVFNAPVTAVIEDTSTRTSAAAVMGVGVGETNLGTFTGATLADGATAKEALQALETGLEASNAADTALSGRLDVLEVDPTTATAVAAGDAATLSSATTYTDTAISNVIGSAPGVLDTLGEIADAINDDGNVYTTLVASIAAVQTDVDGNESDGDAADAALSGRLDTLEADPTTATAVAAVQADVDANETASDAADSALSGRLDVLEADPTTATAVAAVQSDVDQNESDADAALAGEATTRSNADTALSGRLDVLEADPTTATALAAVQSDVDQNETDSDAADAALSGRLDTLEADPTTATAVAAVQADVDQNETDGDAADAALSGRLDTLEADPTTATAVAAVQADVDQNESDADAALALRALLDGSNIPGPYANDTAAASGGVSVGAIYKHDNGQIHYRVS